jgi:hypothetical protein
LNLPASLVGEQILLTVIFGDLVFVNVQVTSWPAPRLTETPPEIGEPVAVALPVITQAALVSDQPVTLPSVTVYVPAESGGDVFD